MKVYIAAPFFNERQLEIVEQVEGYLDAKGIGYFSPRSQGKSLKDMTKEETMNAKGIIFKSNIDAMDSCTHMIACVEQKDTGTSFEIGYYYGKKPVILYSEIVDRINVMLAEAAISVCDVIGMLEMALGGKYTIELGELI